MPRKLVLVVVDSMRPDALATAVAQGLAPNFAAVLQHGRLVEDCVSAFPSVTPVACSDIATGVGPDRHWISGMNWFHRAERRYVEYGSSLEATRACGLFRSLYDTVYNMNMGHLSHEVATIFERLGDAGIRSACTPFLIYRGRTRHELSLEGLMRRVAVAANFRHAVWGPDDLFYGELYASRRVPCRPTLARPGTRDEYSACVGRELAAAGDYDFLLFSLPDNDHHTHVRGIGSMPDSIAHADRCFGELVDAGGGIREFLEDHAVILMADHGQTDVKAELPLAGILGDEWRVLTPNAERPELAEIAVSPTARAAGVYVLTEGARAASARIRSRLRAVEGIELVSWLRGDGAAVARGEAELRFAPGSSVEDERGEAWDLDGDPGVLGARVHDGRIETPGYPDALSRLWSALNAPHAGDILVSLAEGFECVDWGGASHVGGGSHGALAAGDSLVPLATCGVDAPPRDRWALRDVAGLVLAHFGLDAGAPPAQRRLEVVA